MHMHYKQAGSDAHAQMARNDTGLLHFLTPTNATYTSMILTAEAKTIKAETREASRATFAASFDRTCH